MILLENISYNNQIHQMKPNEDLLVIVFGKRIMEQVVIMCILFKCVVCYLMYIFSCVEY